MIKGVEKKDTHVRRHIELTAALTEMLEQKNKSNRIERLKNEPIDLQSKINSLVISA